MSSPVLRLTKVERTYVTDSGELPVLRGVDLELAAGEIVGLIGPSGSGKSSLLHSAGLLERPDGGKVEIGGENCSEMKDGARTRVRLGQVGFVYQFHHLLPEFSALQNVGMPALIAGHSESWAAERATELLTQLGLAERLHHQPAQLSGGEQQRVAIARALTNHPRLLLADEPTGNLDPTTAARVMDALVAQTREHGAALVLVTHSETAAARADRVLHLSSEGITG